MQHHELTGPAAIHPVAFVQGTDPALDVNNYVTAYKFWIDTANSNALKMRNATNDAWTTIVSGAAQVGGGFRLVDFIIELEEAPSWEEPNFNDIDYV